MGEVIRFSNEDKRDYPVDKIHYCEGETVHMTFYCFQLRVMKYDNMST
jgi:hypothetical protein